MGFGDPQPGGPLDCECPDKVALHLERVVGVRAQILAVHVVLEVMVRPRWRHVAVARFHGEAVDVDGLARLEEEEDGKETGARLREWMMAFKWRSAIYSLRSRLLLCE